MPIFPDQLFIKLPWTWTYEYSTTTGYHEPTTLSLNSPWDPDQSIGATQEAVLGWTEWSRIYARYQCFGCKAVLRWYNRQSSTNEYAERQIGGYMVQGSGQGHNAPTTQLYRKDPHWHPVRLGSFWNGGGKNAAVQRTGYISCAKVENVPKMVYAANVDDYSAPVNQKPTKQPIMILFFDNDAHGPGGGNAAVGVAVEITYYVKLWNKDQLTE